MSPLANFVLVLLYLSVASAIAVNEYRTVQRAGSDSFTIILAFLFIYLLGPSIGIHLLLGIYGENLRTGNYFFDKIYEKMDVIDSITIYLLTVLFIIGLYLSAGTHRAKLKARESVSLNEFQSQDKLTYIGMLIVLFICTKFFLELGSNFIERYANLILFRNLDPSIVRSFFSANAFSLTQTLTWLAAGIFFLHASQKNQVRAVIFFLMMLFAAFLMGSRRGLIFPVLIIYFCSVLNSNKFHYWKLVLFIPLSIFWIGFGKELTGSIAYNVEQGAVLTNYDNAGELLLRSFSDIGISQIQSFGVLQYFEVSPRLGIDHLLSLLRRLPDGMIGLNIEWPERIVRITTEVFASKSDADIPPGLIGQSWLDFPIFGALFWGLFIGTQSHFLDRWASRARQTSAKTVVVTLMAIVIALPINTGSYDYTFSIDIIFLVLLISIFFRFNKAKKVSNPKAVDE